jgi:Zn-dependent protease/predicted transcriptional regulator
MPPKPSKSAKQSWRIGEFAGIAVYIHPSFLILVLWVLIVYWNTGHSVGAMVSGLGFTLALFLCVILHEFGHALTARHYGIRTEDITLLPIGGISRLERMPEEPRLEFYVALMGPLVSVAIALLLFLVLRLAGSRASLATINSWTAASFLERLMIANATLAVFNLLPAFPMDGGRIFRAFLARYIGFGRATQLAAKVGQAVAVLFGVFGLFANPFLLLIAFFIWIEAAQEAAVAQMKSNLAGTPVSELIVTDFVLLSPTDTLRRAVGLVLHGTQQNFPVVADGRLVGMLTNKELLQGLSQRGANGLIADVMRQDYPFVEATDDLEVVLDKLQSSTCRTLAVVDKGKVVGLFTADNLAEFVMVQSALGKRKGIDLTHGPGAKGVHAKLIA